MTEHLLGLTALGAVGVLFTILARRWPAARALLLIAFSARALAALFHFYIAPLPDGLQDATTFERVAWEWAQGSLADTLGHFTGPSGYIISWILAVFYSIFDRSPLLGQALSVGFGTGAVFLGWHLARLLWDERAARVAGWAMALFPTLIQYHALILREAYIHFFLVVALIGVVLWARQKQRFGGVILALAGFTAASFFHGAVAVGALAFLVILTVRSFSELFSGVYQTGRIPFYALTFLVAGALALPAIWGANIQLPSLGTFERATDREVILDQSLRRSHGGAAYPDWVQPQSLEEFPYKAPAQIFYFVFSPFPWDIRGIHQLMGLVLDSVFYIAIFFLLWRLRKTLWRDPASRYVLIILLGLTVVYAFGTANFGTGIRHRAKMVIGFLALVAPKIPRLVVRSRAIEPESPRRTK